MSEHHIVSKSVYYGIFATLMVLTAVTVGVAYVDLGKFNLLVALTVAVIKATLVVLYFMHIRYSSRLMMVVITAGFFWFGILIVLTLGDYLTRYLLVFPNRAPM